MSERRVEIIFALIMITLLLSVFWYEAIKDNRKSEEVRMKYSRISLDDSINGVVESTYLPVGWRGESIGEYVTFKTGKKFLVHI